MRLIRPFLSTIAVMLTASSVFAADRIPEFDSMTSSGLEAGYLDVEKRGNFVEAVATYCKTTLAELPTNTPAETEWLNGEMQTTDMTKIERVFLSKEYARFKLGTLFTSCIKTSGQILQAQTVADTRLEAQLYLMLLSDFSGSDIEFYAKKASVDSSRFGMGLFGIVRTSINNVAATAIADIR
jgi:hypothetical protein